jgi:hypothetical protein
MLKRLILILLCSLCSQIYAQRITRQYRNVSMADALRELNTLQRQYTVNFIYDELEDFRVTTAVRGLSVPDAIRQLIGFYPIRMTQQDDVLLVECTHKTTQKYTGRVVDRQGNAIEFANVTLLHPDTQALIAGGVTNADGMFVIPCDAPSALLRITYVGYKTVNQRVGNPRVGTIRMDEDHITLKGVNVTEIRPTVTYKADRYVVNIRGSILGKGNTAESLLTQLPGVWVNGSSISINGIGGTQVMVNDRSVNLTGDQLINYLKTIRSEEIENIEIISNPPAEFAAEGKGGYLRIITRQRQSGSSLTVGTDLDLINYNALEPNVSYSYNKGKFGFDASANGTLGKGYLRSDELTRNSETHTDYDNRITDRMDDLLRLQPTQQVGAQPQLLQLEQRRAYQRHHRHHGAAARRHHPNPHLASDPAARQSLWRIAQLYSPLWPQRAPQTARPRRLHRQQRTRQRLSHIRQLRRRGSDGIGRKHLQYQ